MLGDGYKCREDEDPLDESFFFTPLPSPTPLPPSLAPSALSHVLITANYVIALKKKAKKKKIQEGKKKGASFREGSDESFRLEKK